MLISRSSSGASLTLVIAVFGTAMLLIMFFCMRFTGFIGSYHEQRTAIEAAALAASKDLSAIVIVDPNFGYVGLSDASPIGTATQAGDGFYTSAIGINTLFGTIRLDLIIADYLQDPIIRQMALNDYQNALTTQQNLVTALNAAVAANGTGSDINGNTVNPTLDATNAYGSNNIHLSIGQSSNLVPGSLKLSLGYVGDLTTRTPVPQPSSIASVSSSQQSNGFYLANTKITYTTNQALPGSSTTTAFSFAALSANARLVDFRAFQTSMSGLPFSTPTIVKADADESFVGSNLNHTVHSTAAALAGTVVDQRPSPGAFTITFTDGPPPEIQQPGDLINNSQLANDPADMMQTPPKGDYPQNPLVPYSMPYLPDPDPYHPRWENVLSVALYDWIRNGGTTVNVQSLLSALQTNMNYQSQSGGAQQQRFHLTSSGQVTNDSISWSQTDLCVSNNQYRAISGLAIVSSNKHSYDCQITDYTRVLGNTNGGIHAGEPLNVPGTTGTNTAAYYGPSMFENTTWSYQEFLTGSGATRPTYNSNPEGIAVDVTIRKRQGT